MQQKALQDMIFLKSDRRVIRVDISQIQYIEGMSEYLKVWVNGESKPLITLLSIKKIEERLPNHFMRIHRSYIVNCRMIKEVNKGRIILDSQTELPLGDTITNPWRAAIDKIGEEYADMIKQVNDFIRHFRVNITCWFVRNNNACIIYKHIYFTVFFDSFIIN